MGTSFKGNWTDAITNPPTTNGGLWVGSSITVRATDNDSWSDVTHLRFYETDTGSTDFDNILKNLSDDSFIRLADSTSSNFAVLKVSAVPVKTDSYYTVLIDNSSVLQSSGSFQRDTAWTVHYKVVTEAYVDGNLVVDGTIEARQLNADFILSRTVRSPNYVAPNVTDNPPVQGYSLEHGQGIGFFEELRADLTGTVSAPSTTPSSSTATFGAGSVVTKEYLNVSQGDPWEAVSGTDWENDNTYTFNMIIGDPIWSISVAPDDASLSTTLFTDLKPASYLLRDFDTSTVEIYSNHSGSVSGGSFGVITVRLGLVPYKDGVRLPEWYMFNIQGTSTTIASPAFSGFSRSISSATPFDSSNVNTLVSTLNAGYVGVDAVYPDRLDVVLMVVESRNLERGGTYPTCPIDLVAGINVNSAVTLTIGTEGSTNTYPLTQL